MVFACVQGPGDHNSSAKTKANTSTRGANTPVVTVVTVVSVSEEFG